MADDRVPETKPDDAIIRRMEQVADALGVPHMKPYARWRLGYAQDRADGNPLSTTGRGADG